MKTILIATDFSRASRVASLYGVQLAKTINAKIILFNAYSIPAPVPGFNVGISRYDVMIQTKERLKKEAENIKYINMPPVEILCDEGKADDVIVKVANEKKADFIIAGMKGSGRSLKKMFGSTATSLAKKSDVPVIIVPEETRFRVPKIIMHASDCTPGTRTVINRINTIKNYFKCKSYVVRVLEDECVEVFEQVNRQPENLKKELRILDTTFQFQINTDIRHALNDFIEKYHVDMLVMVPHKHELLERLFKKSKTMDMIFHTSIPLIVLPEVSLKEEVPQKEVLKIENQRC